MNLPARFNSQCFTSAGISENKWNEAVALFEQEKYLESQQILEDSLPSQGNQVGLLLDFGVDFLALYAWNLFFLKKNDHLVRILGPASGLDLESIPKVHLIWLRFLLQRNKLQEVLDSCLAFIQEHNNPISPLVAEFMYLKGIAEYQIGNPGSAVQDLEVSYSLFQLMGDELGKGWAGNYLGFVFLRLSNFSDALHWHDRSLAAFGELNLARKQSMVLLNQGITYYKIGDYARSLESLKTSHQIGIAGNWPHRQLFTNIALGNVYRITRDNRKARKHLHTAYSQAQELQFPREEALALEFLGDVYRDEGHFEDAFRFYNRAMSIGMAIAPRGDIVMEVHRRLGECHLAQLDLPRAQEELRKALALARAQEDRYEEGVILRVFADVWFSLGEIGEANRTIEESVVILDSIGARHELAISLMKAAEFDLAEIEQGRPSVPVSIVLTRAWDKATRAMDHLLKVDVSWWTDRCRRLIKKISAMRDGQETVSAHQKVANASECVSSYHPSKVIIHKSRRMKDILRLCDLFAQSQEPALITGETGTGKELLARRLHEMGDRAGGNLVSVNVSAIPASLFEREFFGHSKGAFSGAESDKLGYAGLASGGTLFLDEIGDLPLEVQPKLLRLLQDGTYLALGDPAERYSDIRLIAATNADLDRKVQLGEFRADLYYRLRILELELPPLRDRPEDVLLLLRHFLSEAAGRPVDLSDYFNRESLDLMEYHEWPGNVREVAMVARRAQMELVANGRVEMQLLKSNGGRVRISGRPEEDLGQSLTNEQVSSDAVERTRIILALEESGGSKAEAARQLEMSRSTLYRRMDRLGLNFS
jgi:transcriptional regulator with PAS, ATPase and Fis domain